ncbi:unnamed protein product, partial [Porites lobata]
VDQLDCTLFQPSDANLRYFPSFQQLMSEISTNDNVPTTNKWWLLQVSRGLPSSKTSNGCHVSGFWLEMLPSSQQPDHGCALRLQRG